MKKWLQENPGAARPNFPGGQNEEIANDGAGKDGVTTNGSAFGGENPISGAADSTYEFMEIENGIPERKRRKVWVKVTVIGSKDGKVCCKENYWIVPK